MSAKTLHDHRVLDSEHDARIVLGSAGVIAGVFGLWSWLGLGPDQVATFLGATGAIVAIVTRRLERKRRAVVKDALGVEGLHS